MDRRWLLAAAFLASVSCGGGGNGAPPPPPSNDPQPPVSSPPPADGTVTISSNGGSARLAGVASVTFAPGSLPAGTLVRVSQIAIPQEQALTPMLRMLSSEAASGDALMVRVSGGRMPEAATITVSPWFETDAVRTQRQIRVVAATTNSSESDEEAPTWANIPASVDPAMRVVQFSPTWVHFLRTEGSERVGIFFLARKIEAPAT
ncbi:MAG TPA: hypothetical protein VEA60_01425 [Allosphingosinicella sp.]|nr:hypothetical protein [Allosphingosinicella sp.]